MMLRLKNFLLSHVAHPVYMFHFSGQRTMVFSSSARFSYFFFLEQTEKGERKRKSLNDMLL